MGCVVAFSAKYPKTAAGTIDKYSISCLNTVYSKNILNANLGMYFLSRMDIIWGMNSQDILNLILVITIIIVASCIVYATYYFVQALKSIKILADNFEQITEGIKGGLKFRALATIPALFIGILSKLLKRR